MTRTGEALPAVGAGSGARSDSKGVRHGASLLGLGALVMGLFVLLSGGGSGGGAGPGSRVGGPSSAAGSAVAVRHPHHATPVQAAAAKQALGRLPLRFEQNAGQTDPRVRFLSRGPGYTLFLTPTEAVLRLIKPSAHTSGGRAATAAASGHLPVQGAVLRMGLVGARPHPALTGGGALRTKSNYLIGGQRHTGVSNYREVTYHSAYPGIDLVYHGRSGRLEYDFNLAAGADPGRIALAFKGIEQISIDNHGDLLLRTAAGVLRQPRPLVYQQLGARKLIVPGRYELIGHNRVGFRLGRYARSLPLVIDPAITYSSYLSGTSASSGDQARDIAVDGSGSAYITGAAASTDFPVTTGAFQSTDPGDPNAYSTAFVAKLDTNAVGAASLVYATFLGGSTQDEGRGIAIDSSGNAYVTGGAISRDFPTKNALPGVVCGAGSGGQGDIFVTELNPTGSGLVYSTCLGSAGFGADGNKIAVDASGAAYVTGTTYGGLPTVGAFQSTPGGGGNTDAFLTKLNPGGAGVAYSTYLGGAGNEEGTGIAVDGSGNAYVSGDAPAGFPTTTGAFQTANAGGQDAFVAKIDTTVSGASSLKYSSYLGGSLDDDPYVGINSFPPPGGVAVRNGNAYLTGVTSSTDFPTHAPLQGYNAGGGTDAFVAEFDTTGTGLVYSTYLGGSGQFGDQGAAIAVDSAGRATVVGTAQAGFPTVNPLPGSSCDSQEAFAANLVPDGSALRYSTCIPGTELGAGIALDSAANAYVVGSTSVDGLEVVNGPQEQRNPGNTFVVKLSPVAGAAPRVSSVAPAGGPSSGQTRVVITGSRFIDASAVSFGGTPAPSFTVDSDTQITAISPAHISGKAYVTVSNPAGSTPAQSSLARYYYGEGGWTSTGALGVGRRGQSATLLPGGPASLCGSNCGKVLVAGGRIGTGNGTATATAELYDPKTGAWSDTGGLGTARAEHTATLLPNGKVLVAGGRDQGFNELASAELYDPISGTWSATGSLGTARAVHTATLLPSGPASLCGSGCGKVLIAGGDIGGGGPYTPSAELYDPASGTWTATGSLGLGIGGQAATLLPSGPSSVCGANCGKVLVTGGTSSGGPSAELYDPLAGTWSQTPGDMSVPARFNLSANLLGNGRVLAAGGGCFGTTITSSAELFDPVTGAFAPTTNTMASARTGQASALLPSGKVLVAGGDAVCEGALTNTAEVYDPTVGASGSWLAAGALEVARGGYAGQAYQPSAIVISSNPSAFAADSAVCAQACGRVLILGGASSNVSELYTPPPRLTAIAPASGGVAGGTAVTITGGGLNNGLRAVSFGGVPATSFTADSYGQITAVAPPHAIGPVDISVVTDGGGTALTGSFTYLTGAPLPPAAKVTRLRISPHAFPAAAHGASATARKKKKRSFGARVSFVLNIASRVRFTALRLQPGRKHRHGRTISCVRPSKQNRKARHCTRLVVLAGSFTVSARAGSTRFHFSGRLAGKKLKPATYTLVAIPTANGKRGRPITTSFRIIR